ncbi:hypothetical protein LPB67_10150 [Undibacterium sp. Jales W-56]|uniref:polysaccharide deacetylase family protein n=1 Tax=Undibacterium sp. Jales W-56 TaxID=2897325 RepID=UPI0021D1E850|nr:hypothetical protein [Undibacterium sp. Jales W-56]MCU6434129.1 hypothetical protein [Undibacterium sp. Jales W-56]
MLDVFFTVDVEIWCGGWKNLDARFPQAFQQYVYGRTPKGEYGLRYQLKELRDHGLYGVFFIESLFATRFGIEPLAEIVGLVQEYGHEVQLHMHPEWVDEAREPLFKNSQHKRQFMRQFSLEEQTILIAKGMQLLEQANGGRVHAFRAGSFGFNRDTLHALAANHIPFDSSYNASMMGLESGVLPGQVLHSPVACDGVIEYPMTIFDDGTGSYRHAQLGACTNLELEGLMKQALEQQRQAFVILSHNFELMNPQRDNADLIMIKRFRRFCEFMAEHKTAFQMRGFHQLSPATMTSDSSMLTSPLWKTMHRMAEQVLRRRY